VSGRGRRDPITGANTTFNPVLPLGNPNGVRGPRAVDCVLNVPRLSIKGLACNDVFLRAANYHSKLDGTITAISVERKSGVLIYGCVIKQATLRLSARFECR
jgi:hypothetical protein